MTSRREFLQIGIAAASAWPLAARAADVTLPIAASRAALPLYKVIYDSRFPHSAAFGRRATELGASVRAIEGDMTRFWYDDLYYRWKQGPVAIAGLTAHGPLFCLEQLALDQRMRVVFRAEHSFASEGCVDHRFSGPIGMLGASRDAAGSDDWAVRMADLVTRCPSGRAEIAAAAGRTAADAAAVKGESLYSWVIAPAVRT